MEYPNYNDYMYIVDNDTYTYSTNKNFTEPDSFNALPLFPRVHLILMIILIIISNAIVLAVLPRMKNCLTKMKLFLQSLATADLWVGLMWFVIHIDSIFAYKVVLLGYWQCLLIIHLLLVVLTVSVLTLSMISVERYIAVVKPFKYHKLVTPVRAKYAVMSIWLLSLMLYLPVYIVLLFIKQENSERQCDANFSEVVYTCFYLLSVIIVPNVFLSLYCYTCIIKKIRSQAKFSNKHGSFRRKSGRRTESKLAKISISLYSGFYISWLPFVVVSLISYISTVDINPVAYHATLGIGLWNSVLNCLIYSISHKPFRRELKRLFLPELCTTCCSSRSCCCRRTAVIATGQSTSAAQPWHTSTATNMRKLSKSKLTPIADNLEKGYFNNEGIVLEISQNI